MNSRVTKQDMKSSPTVRDTKNQTNAHAEIKILRRIERNKANEQVKRRIRYALSTPGLKIQIDNCDMHDAEVFLPIILELYKN